MPNLLYSKALSTLIIFSFAIGLSRCATPTSEASKPTEWIPFTRVDGHISVPLEIAGKRVHGVFDTSIPLSLVSSKLAGPSAKEFGQACFGDIPKSAFVSDDAVKFDDFRAEIESNLATNEFDAIIGANFLASSTIEIDFPKSRLRFHTPGYAYKGAEKKIPLAKKNGLFYLQLNIDGEAKVMLLDTASTGVLRLATSEQKMKSLKSAGAKRVEPKGCRSTSEPLLLTKVPEFRFGGYKIKEAKAEYVLAGDRLSSFNGILGLDVLEDFVVIIDTVHMGIYLERPTGK